jgi:acyl-CoA synthetase (AMP-forming)/AMP-acid ligase II
MAAMQTTCHGLRRKRRGHAGRADVPRQRLGIAFAPDDRREAGHAGRQDGRASIYELLDTEKVTFTAAVPTSGWAAEQHLREQQPQSRHAEARDHRRLGLPEAILRAFEEDYGVEVIHAWGMTEMSPLGTLGKLLPPHSRRHETALNRS